jgi:hypothetical protein
VPIRFAQDSLQFARTDQRSSKQLRPAALKSVQWLVNELHFIDSKAYKIRRISLTQKTERVKRQSFFDIF